MTEKTIREYQPSGDDVVELIPTRIDFLYCRPQGKECIAVRFDDDSLGAFAMLLTPEAARLMAESLTSMAVTDLDRLRHEHADRFGPK
jgi:hypothetical protein